MLEESEVFDSALALSEDRRAELAKQLIQSLGSMVKEPGYDEAWVEEIERRSNEVHEGCVLISREEFESRLNKMLEDARSARGARVSTSS